MKTLLTWQELDRCDTANEIADILRRRGIRGAKCNERLCPLAVATGWRVDYARAWRVVVDERRYIDLTPAEREFVERFDRGAYPDLDID